MVALQVPRVRRDAVEVCVSGMGMASSVLQQVSNLGKRIGSGLLDLAVPMTCHGCRAPVSAPGGLCPECWGQLELVSAPVCDVYGTPMSHDAGPGAVSARAIEAAGLAPGARCRGVQ
jgi:citrate lyase alpha subunit